MQGQYILESTIELPNFKARIFRPVLTAEEQERRLQNIRNATKNLLIETVRLKK